MAEIALINKSERKFIDISSEEERTYCFIKEYGMDTITIGRPQWLSVSHSGHYVLTLDGAMHYIPYGWIQLRWTPRPGQPHITA